MAEFLDTCDDPAVGALVSQIGFSDEYAQIEPKTVEECVFNLRKLRIKHRLNEISKLIKESERLKDEVALGGLLQEYKQVLSDYNKFLKV